MVAIASITSRACLVRRSATCSAHPPPSSAREAAPEASASLLLLLPLLLLLLLLLPLLLLLLPLLLLLQVIRIPKAFCFSEACKTIGQRNEQPARQMNHVGSLYHDDILPPTHR